MAYKRQLRDKDGNVVYPDVGLNLDDVVYSDDPTESIEGDIADPYNYSQAEKWTGKLWIDGKKVYRRVFTGTCSNTAGVRANVTLWASAPVDTIISVCGQVQYSDNSGNGYNVLPFGSDGATENRYVYRQNGTSNINLAIMSQDASPARKYVVIMEYTKS